MFHAARAGFGRLLLAAFLTVCAGWVHALSPEQAFKIAAGESDERIAALSAAAASADPGLRAFVQALLADEVKVAAGRAYVVRDGQAAVAGSGASATLPDNAEDVVNNNRMRRELESVLAGLRLFSTERAERAQALDDLKDQVDASRAGLLEKALAAEQDPALRVRLEGLLAAALVNAEDPAVRLKAAQRLAGSADPSTRALLRDKLGQETDAQVKAALERSLAAVEGRLAWGERLGVLFTGISLGSILMLAALGLAITYGLMGVINMAHGELIMIGAYATYMVQNLFRQFLPGAFDLYVLAAIPVSFVVAAGVGAAMERSVIRWLYGRPLETLLATWGLSLILMQAVRSVFGAQNVAGVALLIGRTRLGLFVRGVTQNRRMAACVGVHTARVDTWAFSLGAGIAGLAGCALSQVGNVGPDLGQSYIVDSFMVVVLGGVGQLAGTVYAGLGLGLLNKLLEGWQGAVLAKIMVLVFIVAFIQKRPQGLFALKGRSAEA